MRSPSRQINTHYIACSRDFIFFGISSLWSLANKLVVDRVMSTKSMSSLIYGWSLSMEWYYKLILEYMHVNLTQLSFFEVSSLRFILNQRLPSFIHPRTTVHSQLGHGYATDDWVRNMIWGMSKTVWAEPMSPWSTTMWPCPIITTLWPKINVTK